MPTYQPNRPKPAEGFLSALLGTLYFVAFIAALIFLPDLLTH